jgi:hypothetical protein
MPAAAKGAHPATTAVKGVTTTAKVTATTTKMATAAVAATATMTAAAAMTAAATTATGQGGRRAEDQGQQDDAYSTDSPHDISPR